eukprot:1159235-Pelagomonas_calceolata.AAC.12
MVTFLSKQIGEIAEECMLPPMCLLTCRLIPFSVQMPTVLSMEPENRSLTVAAKYRHVTMPLCPCCVRINCPFLQSHTCTRNPTKRGGKQGELGDAQQAQMLQMLDVCQLLVKLHCC